MKTILLYSVILMAAILVWGSVQLTLSPFSMNLPKWKNALGWLLVVIGMIIIQYQSFEDGKQSFIDEVKELIKEKRRPSDRV